MALLCQQRTQRQQPRLKQRGSSLATGASHDQGGIGVGKQVLEVPGRTPGTEARVQGSRHEHGGVAGGQRLKRGYHGRSTGRHHASNGVTRRLDVSALGRHGIKVVAIHRVREDGERQRELVAPQRVQHGRSHGREAERGTHSFVDAGHGIRDGLRNAHSVERRGQVRPKVGVERHQRRGSRDKGAHLRLCASGQRR